MQRRRIITRVIVFLLLGAIVNVAVAWGLAWDETVNFSGGWDGGPPNLSDDAVKHVCRRYGYEVKGEAYGHEWPQFGSHEISIVVPDSVRTEYLRHTRTDTIVSEVKLRSFGWPVLAMRYELQWADGLRCMYAVKTRVEPWRHGTLVEAFPLMPSWPGFAINTLFYAGILWLLFAAPFALRRRRRIKRGLCPACAYPVGKSNVCTECGKPVRAPGVEPVPQ